MPPGRDIPHIPPPDPAPRAPTFDMPAGAWDTHFHVIDSAHGFVDGRSYDSSDRTLDELAALHRALGVARGVFVQMSIHGTDNRAMLRALERAPKYRGVAVADASVSNAELERMHAFGVRALRINVLFGGGIGFELARTLAERIAGLGWHMQLLISASAPDVPWRELEALPVNLVVDHMGFVPAAEAMEDPGFQRLIGWLRDGRAWVKLSGAERMSALSEPPFTDVVPMAQALIDANPERVVWGSDWPHVVLPVAMPNDGELLDQLALWAPDVEQRRKILVDNPERLYGP